MQQIDGAMRVKMAHLQPKSLWDRTGRADLIGDEVRINHPKQ
jgi:prolyl-tRNA synthetase